MKIEKRMREVILYKEAKSKDLEELTGIDRDRWNNLRKTNPTAKVRAEEVEAVINVFPEYAYWLATGGTLPEQGQISPITSEEEEKRRRTVEKNRLMIERRTGTRTRGSEIAKRMRIHSEMKRRRKKAVKQTS